MTTLRDQLDTIHQKKVETKNGTIVLDYISWSQAADRLDDAAPEGWSFAIMGIGPDWVHGRLTIGGNRHFENIGYAENADQAWKKEALKDAASDAFKRCAALAGVGRYLYDKDSPNGTGRAAPSSTARPAAAPARTSTSVPEEPEFPPDEWAQENAWDAGATPRSKSDNNECPIHGVTWAGEWGDLWHKTDDPDLKGYCRHPENTRGPAKARR